ncbi:MAG: FAD-binding oxidoreductase [Hyphomicrobium sp.]|uniref:FAD-binding oxidoreductase n=1 Tax=Hyphomicrobium sp. TaxID=82 RepID=UPI00356A54E4
MSSTHILDLEFVLKEAEYKAIDAFCAKHKGIESLSDLAAFLKDRFALELTLDPDIVGGFAVDSSNLPGAAQALCRPKNERECAVILRSCFKAGIPMTLSGGKSNLTGSATPNGGVIISTVRLLTPELEVNSEKRTATVPPGMILEDLRHAVLEQTENQLMFPVDPTSRADACVGGCLACNASGFTPGETGSIRSWVQSIRFLLPDGMLMVADRGNYVSEDGRFILDRDGDRREWLLPAYERPAVKNAGGPFSAPSGQMDFVDLVIGSEGLFGLVTACTLRLQETPEAHLDIFFSLPTETEAVRLFQAANEHFKGDLSHLSAFEYFGVHCRKYMDHETRFFQGEDQVGIYIQEPLSGRDELDAAEAWLELLTKAELDIDEEAMILLDSLALRTLFMEARHSMPANALEVVQHRGAFTIMTDAVVPTEHFAEFLDYTHNLLVGKKLDYLSFGHLGDCHLHFTVLPHKEQIDDAVAAYDDIIAKSADLGGVYSGEHGTGKRKRKDFLRCYGPEAVEQVRRCKAAIDPDFLLNRGNVFEV